MARDLDFSPRRRSVITSAPITPVNRNVKPGQSNNKTVKLVWLWIFIILLVALGTWALWQSLKPVAKSTSSNSLAATGTVPALTSTTQEVDSDHLFSSGQASGTKIKIYDSGAGTSAVSTLQKKLKSLGYESENLDKSQFNYDKTYIWYRAGLEAEATKIQSTMFERVTSLKQIASSGLFDILIYLGAK